MVCDCGHVIGQWLDSIAEKYPFYCDGCENDVNTGKYPWSLTTQVAYGKVGAIKIDRQL